jgi:hypothetical protein
MGKLSDYIDCEKGKSFLIVGAGGTLKEYEGPIKKFMSKNNPVTIGINYMTGFCIPNYHLWTNRQRYRDFGSCINKNSKMIFGCNLPAKLIKKHFKGDYISVDYDGSSGNSIRYEGGKIYGNFRTAGCLAIVIAYLFGACDIYVVGMDGYTLHSREKLDRKAGSHHFYGKGFTDDTTWEQCIEKDRLVYENLSEIEVFGVDFKILTPTKFEKFYDGTVLSLNE